VAREGQPLDLEYRRTVGSERGIVSRDLARKGPRVWTRVSRGREKAISRQLEQCGPSWSVSGIQVAQRIPESRSAEEPRLVWTPSCEVIEEPRLLWTCGKV
jgi:hypothetical protein